MPRPRSARELDPDAPVVVVSSDLSRARETAEIIAASSASRVSRLYPDLRERAYGEAEGVDAERVHRPLGRLAQRRGSRRRAVAAPARARAAGARARSCATRGARPRRPRHPSSSSRTAR